jgi:hypothetical protein
MKTTAVALLSAFLFVAPPPPAAQATGCIKGAQPTSRRAVRHGVEGDRPRRDTGAA